MRAWLLILVASFTAVSIVAAPQRNAKRIKRDKQATTQQIKETFILFLLFPRFRFWQTVTDCCRLQKISLIMQESMQSQKLKYPSKNQKVRFFSVFGILEKEYRMKTCLLFLINFIGERTVKKSKVPVLGFIL